MVWCHSYTSHSSPFIAQNAIILFNVEVLTLTMFKFVMYLAKSATTTVMALLSAAADHAGFRRRLQGEDAPLRYPARQDARPGAGVHGLQAALLSLMGKVCAMHMYINCENFSCL